MLLYRSDVFAIHASVRGGRNSQLPSKFPWLDRSILPFPYLVDPFRHIHWSLVRFRDPYMLQQHARVGAIFDIGPRRFDHDTSVGLWCGVMVGFHFLQQAGKGRAWFKVTSNGSLG